MAKQKRILTEVEKCKIAEAKQELNEYRENIKYIEEKLEDAEDVRNKVEKITSILSVAKTNGDLKAQIS